MWWKFKWWKQKEKVAMNALPQDSPESVYLKSLERKILPALQSAANTAPSLADKIAEDERLTKEYLQKVRP